MLVLTREEVRELTGSYRRDHQRRHLTAMGVPYVVNASGWPVVDRQAYAKAMGGEAANEPSREEAVLNLEAIR